MKPISIPKSCQSSWITGVSDEALPATLIELCNTSPAGVNVVLFDDARSLSRSLQDFEALLDLPIGERRALEPVELPLLADYSHLDSLAFEKKCDILRTLASLSTSDSQSFEPVIFTTVEALFQTLPHRANLDSESLSLAVGAELPFGEFCRQLSEDLHYTYEAVCEDPGQFAVRGGIIDVYPVNELQPYRIDFFGDEIESIKSFDPTSQITEKEVQRLLLLPCPDSSERTDPGDPSDNGCLIDSLRTPVTWLLRHPAKMEKNHPERFSQPERLTDPRGTRRFDAIWKVRDGSLDTWHVLDDLEEVSACLIKSSPDAELLFHQLHAFIGLDRKALPTVGAHADDALQSAESHILKVLMEQCRNGYQVVLGLSKQDEVDRIRQQIPLDTLPPESFLILPHPIAHGLAFKHSERSFCPSWIIQGQFRGILLVSEADLHPYLRIRLGSKRQRRRAQQSQVDAMLDFSELAEGDYLVHQQHGICIFKGFASLDYSTNMESLSLEFAEGSMLYLPLTETHLITRYVGLTKRTPKLGKLGSKQWERERKAAEGATLELAAQLLRLQAIRELSEGFAFPPDDSWMQQFEQAFPYKETPDQLTAIEQTKLDMEKPRPMDRLICGDVGFGKTEVAIRAAFKAVEGGKQVAVLVPTTVLCQQHFQTFYERMAPFPVNVASLSAFSSTAQQRKTLQKLAHGEIDIVIATHRLLSSDVRFNRLGLLVVDEEHRFGVKQKEKLKQISEKVDILSLSATPIPRTLYLALSGARDLSVIETPPINRRPIETIVRSYSKNLVDAAIRAEVDRGGQVFYLHNRVTSIDTVAASLQDRHPELRIAVGHGQMERKLLEHIMTRFVEGSFDVMVCTTIIESGLDIPNCNTLIIEGADKFGLAQLYQIRGRVGRFNRQAYAYLLLHGRRPIADIARKRLSALRQHNELGAGYRIAMRDLELRGAGNILGAAQSGHIAGVGFELYCQLLKQSISRFKDGSGSPVFRATVNLDFVRLGEPGVQARSKPGSNRNQSNYAILKESMEEDEWISPIHAFIPKCYLAESSLRIQFYRKLAIASDLDEIKEIRASLKNRFGKIPNATEALIRVSALRCLAELKGIASVETEHGKLKLQFAHQRELKFHKVGTRFPRLTKKQPLLVLNDCINFVSKL